MGMLKRFKRVECVVQAHQLAIEWFGRRSKPLNARYSYVRQYNRITTVTAPRTIAKRRRRVGIIVSI